MSFNSWTSIHFSLFVGFRFFSLYFVFLLYRFRRFFPLEFVFLLYRFRFISLDFVFLLYRFRFISLDFVSYFTDFVSFRWISFSYFTDFIGFCFRFVSFHFISFLSLPVPQYFVSTHLLFCKVKEEYQEKELKWLWKESLNSDSHQFHQYQQNKQSPLILTEVTEHKKDHDVWRWKSRSWLGTCTKMRRDKPVNAILTLFSW